MIKITADSTCDLPREVIAQYQIGISPLGVVKGEELHRDNVDITTADIVAHVAAGGEITTTNAVNIADYYTFFQAEKEGYDGLVHITIGSGFSSCYQNAVLVANELEQVHVVDSENLSLGHGMLVMVAAQMAQQGASAEEIVDKIESLRSKVELSFVLSTLDYMKKGGRCSAVLALGANLLKIHPCIEVVDGKMIVTKKFRGSLPKVIATYVQERLEGRTDIDSSMVVMADACNNPDHEIIAIVRETVAKQHAFDSTVYSTVGCAVFCHCGPDTVGFAFLRK